MISGRMLFISFLIVGILWSALAIVDARHQSRKLYAKQEEMRVEADKLAITWGQLQLELATFADYGRVAKLARDKLSMRTPRIEEIQILDAGNER